MAASIIGKVGRSISGMSGRSMVGVGVASFGLGMANTVGPEARDATFDAVLGTPDADRYFTGRKFSARFLAGQAIGGPVGTAMQATAPSDSLAVNPAIPTNPVVSGPAGMGIGGLIGFGAAKRFGFGAGKSIAIGAAIGGTMGAAAPVQGALSYTRQNRDFFTESPYGRSSSANAELSAVGDIVLGMHNSRRGY